MYKELCAEQSVHGRYAALHGRHALCALPPADVAALPRGRGFGTDGRYQPVAATSCIGLATSGVHRLRFARRTMGHELCTHRGNVGTRTTRETKMDSGSIRPHIGGRLGTDAGNGHHTWHLRLDRPRALRPTIFGVCNNRQ